MVHGHMTHSLVVMGGHGKPQGEQLSYWEQETNDEESHIFTRSLRPFYGRWMHVSTIDVSGFWHQLEGSRLNDSRPRSMAKLLH